MTKVKNFNEFINENTDNEIVERYSAFSTVMNKVISFNKREMVAMGNVTNESFRAMYHYNQDVYFSYEERDAIKEMFKEFIPRIAESMINELNEAGCEYDESVFGEIGYAVGLNEDWRKFLPKSAVAAFDKVVTKTKEVANKVGGAIKDDKEYVKDNVEKVKKATADTKKKIVEKYKAIIEFLKKVISNGAKSVREFVANIAKLFEKLGGGIKEALKKLGAFEKEKGEDEANVSIDAEMLKGLTDSDGETAFLKHVVAYMCVMLGDNKKKVDALLGEGIENTTFDFDEYELNEGVMDKIANNKFIQFILCYGKGKKISIWRSILISIVGSVVISFGLPIILPICGVSVAAVPVCVAAVRAVWSARSCFKIVLNRYVNKKAGEKLFDKKTIILLVICILPQIPPFKDWIAEAFGKLLHWLGIDKWLEDASKVLGKLIEKLHGTDPSIKVINDAWDETVNQGGGYQQFTNWEENNAELLKHAKECGTSDKGLKTLQKMLDGAKHIKGSSNFSKYWEGILDQSGDTLPKGMIVDTDVTGVNHLFNKAMQEVSASGEYPGMTTGTIGGEVWHSATKHIAGACNMVYNMPDDAKQAVLDKFVKMGGKLSDLQITEFGEGVVSKVIQHEAATSSINWLFDSLVASFSPTFIPWLDKKKFGKYQMSFGSNTSKLPYHTVTKVEIMDMKDAKKFVTGENTAFNKLVAEISDIQNTHEAYIKTIDDKEEKSKEEKKFVKEQNKHFEENGKIDKRQVLVYFVEWKDKKTGKTEKDVPGVMVDLMSMMCIDICPKRKPRKNPYFVKGMLSRLSFKPVEKNDNDTKQYIRESLGITAGGSVKRMYDYGIGSCIVESKDDKFVPAEKAEKKELAYLGNFTPDEFCEILNDDSDENKVAYSYLSGKYGSKSSTGNGKKMENKHDKNTIENRRYVPASQKIKEDKEVTVRTKDGKKKKKYSEMKKYQEDRYGFRRATPEEVNDDSIKKMDYVEAKLIPLINDSKRKLYKALTEDEDVRKLFFKKKDEGDEYEVDKGLIMSIKDYLYRAESSFSEKDEHNALEKMNAYKKEHNQDEIGKDAYDTIKKAVETIWELKGKYSNSKKKTKKSDDKQPTKQNESRFMSFDEFVKVNE